jgi:hypothetical protein
MHEQVVGNWLILERECDKKRNVYRVGILVLGKKLQEIFPNSKPKSGPNQRSLVSCSSHTGCILCYLRKNILKWVILYGTLGALM